MPENRHHPVRSSRGGRRARKKRAGVAPFAVAGLIVAAALVAGASGGTMGGVVETEPSPTASAEPVETYIEGEDPCEAEKVELALVEQGYFRDDVPLSFAEQDYLHTACEESGTPYALALAVIEQESTFRNIVGDDGASEGYMQVQRRWHQDRMERLGVTDLMDPFSNFRVGCDFLAELLGKYPVAEALTAYNSGSPGHNEYSEKVMANYKKWKELVGDEISGCKS